MLTSFILFCVGAITSMIIDTVWWHVNYKKIEKGFEVLEHYHIGLIALIISVISYQFVQPISIFLAGMGLFFIVAEWHQAVEIHKKKVIPGKPFAYGSEHFKQSSIIGITLAVILLILSLVL